MRTPPPVPQPPAGATDRLLTIGELAERAGLTPELLRTWETRHGFPAPTRLPSGHRRYTDDDVRAVRQVVADRDRGIRLEQAIATAVRSAGVDDTGSVYAALSARHADLPSYTLTKRTLLALSWAIEDECVARASRAVVVGSFQRREFYASAEPRWADLSRTARLALVMADFPRHDETTRPARVALPTDAPLLREWVLACDGPGFSAVLVAWELPGQGGLADPDRQFEALWSVEGPVVRDATLLVTGIGSRLGSRAADRALQVVGELPPPAPTHPRSATAVFNRMVAYADGTVLRGRSGR